jgi:hypothetical protein
MLISIIVFGVISGCLSSPDLEKTMTFTVDSRKIVVDEMGHVSVEELTNIYK